MEDLQSEGMKAPEMGGTQKQCGCHSSGETCSPNHGGQCDNNHVWTLAGAILLGSLIVAASVLTSVPKLGGSSTPTGNQPTTADPTAAQPSQPTVTQDQLKGLFGGKNITLGKKDSKLVFVEFSDPSCPYCHIAGGKNPELNKQAGPQFTLVQDGGTYVPPVPEMKKLVDAGKAAFVWIYANGHGNGEMATKALYCAHEKGKFWPVHDLLMSKAGYDLVNNEVKNDPAKASALAAFLKGAMSESDMVNCLESKKYDDRTTADMATAQQFGFRGTPSFFVNTTNFPGAVSFKDMQSAVDKAIK